MTTKAENGRASALAALGLGVEEQSRRMPTARRQDLNRERARPVVGIRMTPEALGGLDEAAHLLRADRGRPVTRGEALAEVVNDWLKRHKR